MMELCTPLIKNGGCDTIYVMPNLRPPITQVSEAISYHKMLSRLAPEVTFLMSLFLHPSMNANVIIEAAKSKIIHGVGLQLFKDSNILTWRLGQVVSSWSIVSFP